MLQTTRLFRTKNFKFPREKKDKKRNKKKKIKKKQKSKKQRSFRRIYYNSGYLKNPINMRVNVKSKTIDQSYQTLQLFYNSFFNS